MAREISNPYEARIYGISLISVNVQQQHGAPQRICNVPGNQYAYSNTGKIRISFPRETLAYLTYAWRQNVRICEEHHIPNLNPIHPIHDAPAGCVQEALWRRGADERDEFGVGKRHHRHVADEACALKRIFKLELFWEQPSDECGCLPTVRCEIELVGLKQIVQSEIPGIGR